MRDIKDSPRSLVRIGYDGSVYKKFRGGMAVERFENEVRVLEFLEHKGCEFVPRLLSKDADKLEIVTSHAGMRVERITMEALTSTFLELESFGVRHEDQALRNITYSPRLGRFCVIDFEFAAILEPGYPPPPPAPPPDDNPLFNPP